MKIFVYKTLFIFVSIFIIFQLTIGLKIKQIENKIEKFKSKENIENVKNKIRKELRSGIKKKTFSSFPIIDRSFLIDLFLDKLKQTSVHIKSIKEFELIKKENYLTPEDAKLINDFINKLNKELSK